MFLECINHYKINYLYEKINFSLTHINALSSHKICSEAESIKVTTKSWIFILIAVHVLPPYKGLYREALPIHERCTFFRP